MEKEKQFVETLKDGTKVASVFMVSKKEVRQKKDGSNFLMVVLTDKTGSINGVMWDNVDKYSDKFEIDDLVNASGSVKLYDARPQLTIFSIEKTEQEANLTDFLPAAEGDVEQLWEDFENYLGQISDPFLSKLCDTIFSEKSFSDNFKISPAAMALHHNYIGGLLEHTISVIKNCIFFADLYNADKNLLITGAALHDIGKVVELNYSRSFSYSDEGRFIGHLAIADSLICGIIRDIDDFPKETEMMLRHLMLSHHGELEWGSPKRPKTLEALILHHADNLDAKVGMFKQASKKHGEDGWTDSRNPFKRSLYAKKHGEVENNESKEAGSGDQERLWE